MFHVISNLFDRPICLRERLELSFVVLYLAAGGRANRESICRFQVWHTRVFSALSGSRQEQNEMFNLLL